MRVAFRRFSEVVNVCESRKKLPRVVLNLLVGTSFPLMLCNEAMRKKSVFSSKMFTYREWFVFYLLTY